MADMGRGRYIISADAVKAQRDVTIHDGEHLLEECNTDDIGSKSRFDDLQWALDRGYQPCGHCLAPQLASREPESAPMPRSDTAET